MDALSNSPPMADPKRYNENSPRLIRLTESGYLAYINALLFKLERCGRSVPESAAEYYGRSLMSSSQAQTFSPGPYALQTTK